MKDPGEKEARGQSWSADNPEADPCASEREAHPVQEFIPFAYVAVMIHNCYHIGDDLSIAVILFNFCLRVFP